MVGRKGKGMGICSLIFLIISLLIAVEVHGTEKKHEWVTIDFFYHKPCESCRDEEEFIEHLKEVLGEARADVDIHLRLYNTFYGRGSQRLQEALEGDPEEKIDPVGRSVFLGDRWIEDDKDFNQQLKEAFMEAKTGATLGTGKLKVDRQEASDVSGSQGVHTEMRKTVETKENYESLIFYGYTALCSACEEVNRFMDTLGEEIQIQIEGKERSSSIKIQKYNVGDPQDLKRIQEYFRIYQVPEKEQQVPIVFIGNRYLSGEIQIQKELQGLLADGEGLYTIGYSQEDVGVSIFDIFSGYEVLGVLMTGLLNGLNPCSLSMLLFFMATIAVKNVSILKLGGAYILGKFLTYFALGIFLYDLLGGMNGSWFVTFQGYLKYILIATALILSGMNLWDHFASKEERYEKIRMQLPASFRRFNHRWIQRITTLHNRRWILFLSFGLGAIISVGEFLCTGQIYLATILYVLKTGSGLDMRAIMYFIVYGISLVLPLVFLTIGVYKGREIFALSEFLREKMHMIKLANAFFFLLFGMILFWMF